MEKTRADKPKARHAKPTGSGGFSLVELLTILAVMALLAALVSVAFPVARTAAESATCQSNLRQLAAANLAYAADHGRYVAAAEDIVAHNGARWHGVRDGGEAFDGAHGPLAPYLGGGAASTWVRRCPGFKPANAGFETGCGGYGYNAQGVGSEVLLNVPQSERYGMRPGAIAHPARIVMFADTAFIAGRGATAHLIEYSFVEPPQFAGGGQSWPTIHFRHNGRANVAWCDGHVTAETMTFSDGASAAHQLGWFGPKDNSLFDPI